MMRYLLDRVAKPGVHIGSVRKRRWESAGSGVLSRVSVLFLLLSGVGVGLAGTFRPSIDSLPCGFGSSGPAGGCVGNLLRYTDVHRELDLSESQLDRLRNELKSIANGRRSLFDSLVAGNVFDEPIDGAMLRRLLDEYNKQSDQAVMEKLLTSSQRERLLQLQFQLQGVVAFQEDLVAKSLKLSASQRRDIAKAISIAQLHFERIGERLTQGELNLRVVQVLSSNQREQWKAMKGTTFPFAVLCMRHRQSLLTRDATAPNPLKLRNDSSPLAIR